MRQQPHGLGPQRHGMEATAMTATLSLPTSPLTVDFLAAARLLGVSRPTLERWIADGLFGPAPVSPPGCKRLFLISELQRWAESGMPPRSTWPAIRAAVL